jgi:hypothetical protein
VAPTAAPDTAAPPVVSLLWNETTNDTSVDSLGDTLGCHNVKWTLNPGKWQGLISAAETVIMKVRWCHSAWTVEAVSVQYDSSPGSWVAGLYVQERGWEGEVHYWNDYANHGPHSEYCIRNKFKFDVCDPICTFPPLRVSPEREPPLSVVCAVAICVFHHWIELHTYLRGDGTVFLSSFCDSDGF